MSKIVMIVSNPCVGDARVIKMAETVRDMGHEVYVFATLKEGFLPYEVRNGIHYGRFEWNPGKMLREKWYIKTLKFILPFNRIQSFFVKNLSKFLKYRLFSQLMTEQIIAVKPDLIHAHDLVTLQAGADAARLTGAELIYDAHELEVHRNPPLPFYMKKFVGHVERKYSKNAGAVITPGALIAEVLVKTLNKKEVHVIYNSPRVEMCSSTIRKDLAIDEDIPLLLYVGKISMGRGVGEILKILDKLPQVYFAAVGPSDPKTYQQLQQQANKLGVSERFRMLPPVPFDQVVSYISGTTLGLLSVEPVTLSYQYCMPNKLFEMTMAGIPILANELDEVRMFITELRNGKIVDFSETSKLPYEIFSVISNYQHYKQSEETKMIIDTKYSWGAQAKKLNAIYTRLLNNREIS